MVERELGDDAHGERRVQTSLRSAAVLDETLMKRLTEPGLLESIDAIKFIDSVVFTAS